MNLLGDRIILGEGVFPSFALDVILHQTPDGGYVVLQQPGKATKSLFVVDADEMGLLTRIDGRTRLLDLIGVDGPESPMRARLSAIPSLVMLLGLANVGALRFSSTEMPARLALRGTRRFYLPFHVILELTSGCNLFCRHCYANASFGPAEEMPEELAVKIMRQAHELKIDSLQLSGGEPMMHPRFVAILKCALDMFTHVSVSTNGTLLDHGCVDELVGYRHRLALQVSVDGPTAESHDAVRGKTGAFEQAIRAIRLLLAHGIETRACVSVFPETASLLPDTIRMLSDIGVTSITYVPVLPWGRGKASSWSSPDNSQSLRQLKLECQLHECSPNIVDYITPGEMKSIRPNCGAGTRLVVVNPGGDVMPCPTMREPLGCLLKLPLHEVLAQAIVAKLGRLPAPCEEQCERCALLPFCDHCISRGMAMASRDRAHCDWYCRNSPIITELRSWKECKCPGKASLSNSISAPSPSRAQGT